MALLVCLGHLSSGMLESSSGTASPMAAKPSLLYSPPSSVACKTQEIRNSDLTYINIKVSVFLNVVLCNAIGAWGSHFPIWEHSAKGKQQGTN